MSHFRAAVAANPAAFGARVNLASALFNVQAFDEAVTHYERACALAPPEAGLLTDFGCALEAAGRLDEAVVRFEDALRGDPKFPRAHRCLGYVRFHPGEVEAAAECLRRACELEPTDAAGHSALLLVLNCHPDCGPEEIAAEQARWRERHAAHWPRLRDFPNDREVGRPLRIGYVSPDFRGHALGFNLLPLFKQHARAEVEIHCYAEIRQPDIVTEEFRRYAQAWCETNGLSDEQLAERIRADRIDILVDLTLHSPNHRLGVFARKPAPVQVTFAGYPGSTGLDTIDYRLSDPWLDPAGGFERYYSEET
ncbi:MAG: tetratricopeptide repeat protein [Opitutus sp.]|nr:tetratricopeptide repeat protein [Opitutus sp.]